MVLIVLAICLAIIALAGLVMMTARTRSSKAVGSRLAMLDQAFAPTANEELTADIRKKEKQMSAIPLLNRWLTRMNLGPASTLYLYQAGMTVSVGTLLVISVTGFAVLGAILYLRLEAAIPAICIAVIFLPLPFLYVRFKRGKRLLKLEQQLPEALDMMASALRVGHSLLACMGVVAQESADPIGGEMRRCFEEQNFGIELRRALMNLTDRVPVQDFRIFVAAVLIQKESGGNLAEVLGQVAQTTRERFRLKKQVSVHTAQGRMTGWILSLLPLGLGLAMYFVNPGSMSVLWTTSVGLKLLYTSAGMDIVGALIIRKIVAIRV